MIQKLTFNTIVMIVAAVLLVGLIAFGVTQCEQRRNGAAQGRLDTSQAGAAQNSATDAINAVAAAGGREAASEDLTRQNAREIAGAPGSTVRTDPAVDLAGRRALCRRAAYRDEPKCAMFKGAK